MNFYVKVILAGLIGGFISEGIMGALFSSPFIQSILYDDSLQSDLYIQLTPQRNLVVSIIGLIILSISHAWFYTIFFKSIPGDTWWKKGMFWGFAIWMLYWVFQEWFMFHTLLEEPIILAVLELVILFFGSLVEGLVIAWFFRKEKELNPEKL